VYSEGQEHVGVSDLQPVPLVGEIAQAVSVAAAYFEDTLAMAPTQVFSAGPLGAENLSQILISQGVAEADGLRVRELVEVSALLPDAVTAAAPRPWLSGVVGALRG
jgi:type IV pilus assembly protein PilM